MTDIRVLLADDHIMMREGLANIIDASDGIDVVGQADGGHTALQLTEELKPDVLVLDYSMPDLQGASVLGRLKATGSTTRTLVLSTHDSIHYATKALSAGALGYVIKSGALHELVEAIRIVNDGGRYISRALDSQVAEKIGATGRPVSVDSLSQREFELLGHLGRGLSLQEAARTMHVTESTASTYRARLMKKLHLRNTAEIIRFAIENDIGG